MSAAKALLDTYGKKKDDPRFKDHVEFARNVYWDAKVVKRESQLLKRHKFENLRNNHEDGDDPDAYRKTMTALTAEEDGDVVEARKLWKVLVDKYKQDSDESKALWGWVADKRFRDLREVDDLEDRYSKLMKDVFYRDRDTSGEDEYATRVIEAYRFESVGDQSRARDRWERLFRDVKSKPDKRVWYLLAGKRLRELDARSPSADERKKLIEAKLKSAEMMFANAPGSPDAVIITRNARFICRDIRDLYGSDELLKAEVQQAKALLDNYPR